jgi:hypothetical protein
LLNRIKECQRALYADRTSTATMRASQLRLWFASMGNALLCAPRRIGLTHPQLSIRHDAMNSRDVLGRHVHAMIATAERVD